MEGNEQLAIIIPMLREVGSNITDDQLSGPTPCSEFTVDQVLGHMTGLASAFAPMFRGEEVPDQTRDDAPGNSTDHFDMAMSNLLNAVQSQGALERTIQTPGGDMPGSVFAKMVALDGLVHGWDLATSTAQQWGPPESLVAEVSDFARTNLPADQRDVASFGPPQAEPAGADAMTSLAAFTGRTP